MKSPGGEGLCHLQRVRNQNSEIKGVGAVMDLTI